MIKNAWKHWKEKKLNKKNEPTFIQILEWLIEGALISKNLIHHVSNTAAISHNVGGHNFRATLYFVYSGNFFWPIQCLDYCLDL